MTIQRRREVAYPARRGAVVRQDTAGSPAITAAIEPLDGARSDNASPPFSSANPRLTCDTSEAVSTLCPSPGRKTATAAARARRSQSIPGCPAGPAAHQTRPQRVRSSIPRSPARGTGRSSRPLLYPRLRRDQQKGLVTAETHGGTGCSPCLLRRLDAHVVEVVVERVHSWPEAEAKLVPWRMLTEEGGLVESRLILCFMLSVAGQVRKTRAYVACHLSPGSSRCRCRGCQSGEAGCDCG